MGDKLSPAVFLDRDGTLMQDVDYCSDPKDVHLFPGTREALRKLKQAGYKLIIITNQSAIGRGYFNEAAYRMVEREKKPIQFWLSMLHKILRKPRT